MFRIFFFQWRKVAGRYFPTVGMQSQGEIVEANFGALPFVFDIESYAQAQHKKIMDSALKQTIPGDLDTLSEVRGPFPFHPLLLGAHHTYHIRI